MTVPVRRPARPLLLAVAAALLGTGLLLVSSAPVAAQAPAESATVQGTAEFKWEPADVTIAPGGKVTFEVTGGPPHPVESGDGSDPAGDGKFDASPCALENMDQVGDSCTITFAEAGSYPYFCTVHVALGMKGTITVGAGGGQEEQEEATTTTAAEEAVAAPPPPTAGEPTAPGKPAIYYAGWGLLGAGVLLALAAAFGYLRFSPEFRRSRR